MRETDPFGARFPAFDYYFVLAHISLARRRGTDRRVPPSCVIIFLTKRCARVETRFDEAKPIEIGPTMNDVVQSYKMCTFRIKTEPNIILSNLNYKSKTLNVVAFRKTL